MPNIAVASGLRVGVVSGGIDGQDEGVGAGAVGGIGVIKCVDARGGVGGAVPCVTVAGNLCVSVMSGGVNGQIERVDIGAGRAGLAVVEGIGA